MGKNKKNEEIILKNLSLEEKAELGLFGMKKGDGVRKERLRICFELPDADSVDSAVLSAEEKEEISKSEKIAIYREKQGTLLILEGKNENGDDVATSAVVLEKKNAPEGYQGYLFQVKICDKKSTIVTYEVESKEFAQHFTLTDTILQQEIQAALDIVSKTDKELEEIVAKENNKKKSWAEWGTGIFSGLNNKDKKEASDIRAKEIKEKQDTVLSYVDEEKKLRKEMNPSSEIIMSNNRIITTLKRKLDKLLEEVKAFESTPKAAPLVKELTAKRRELFAANQEKEKLYKEVQPRAVITAVQQNEARLQKDIKALEENPVIQEITAKWNEISAISGTINRLNEESHPTKERILVNERKIDVLRLKGEKLLKEIKDLYAKPIVIASDLAIKKAAEELRAKNMKFLKEARIPSEDVLACAHNVRIHGSQKNKVFMQQQSEKRESEKRKIATPLPFNHFRSDTVISFW